MEKIAILNCYEVSKKCFGTGCINSFNERTGSFDRYTFKDVEIVQMIQCGGCNEKATNSVCKEAHELKAKGVRIIHLSSCIKSDCQWYDTFIQVLSKEFEVVDFTHSD